MIHFCRRGAVLALFSALSALPAAASEAEDNHPGARIYEQHCAACHTNPAAETRAPDLESLRQMTADTLRLSLTEGVMQAQGQALGRREFGALIDYLAVRESDSDEWLAGWMCNNRDVDVSARASLPMFGANHQSWRHLSAEAAGLTGADLGNMELAWAVGFPDTGSLRSAPAIVGDTMFYTPVETNRLLAIDINEPCIKWVYDAGTQLRSSVAFGDIDNEGTKALVFADRTGQVHAVDPATGKARWRAEGRHSERAVITGAPVIAGNRIIVPVSGSGVGRGANPRYECCVEHGAVVALDAATGEQRWTYHTMRKATYNGRTNRLGVKLRGPSGAPIWSTPSIDLERGLVYATTGQNTSLPATNTSDAVIAIDLETGSERWVFQALANDVWIIGCRDTPARSTPNCPHPDDSVLKDFDFGAAAILVEREQGDILLAGQKSGDVWALDPDTGKMLWDTRLSQGTPLGGVHWGMATDGTRVFVPINDPGRPWGEYEPMPGMNAVDVATGEILWRTPVTADCPEVRASRFDGCSERFGLSAAPLAIDDAVVAGSLDGKLYVFDGESGQVRWEFDTLRDFETINGFDGKGGSIDSHSVFAGAGMVFVGSGYNSFGQAAGNVLLAFRPKRQ